MPTLAPYCKSAPETGLLSPKESAGASPSFGGARGFQEPRSRSRAILAVFLVLVAASLAMGCKKQDIAVGGKGPGQDLQADSNAAPPSIGRPASAPASAEPVVVSDNGDVNATLGQLSLELRKYVVRTRSVPKTFEEFASKSQAQIPSPPAGKKYAIQNQAIVLVNR